MIRFPPTSIALSESDIDFHLREIQVKEHLYAQGFTRKEVQRYYRQHHGDANGWQCNDDALSTRSASVNLETTTTKEQAQGAKAKDLASEPRIASETASLRTVSSGEKAKGVQQWSHALSDPPSSSPVSIPSSPPVNPTSVPYRHAAVRQSSLLRIMHTAGSQSSAGSDSSSYSGDLRDDPDERDESELGSDDFLQSPATKSRSYRPRSKTYTYVESEAEPPTPPSQPILEQGSSPPEKQFSKQPDGLAFESAERYPQQQHTLLNPQSSPSWPEPDIPSPLTLPPPLSISRRTASLQFSLPDRTKSSTPETVHQEDLLHPSSILRQTNLPIDAESLDTRTMSYRLTTSSPPPTSSDLPPTDNPEEHPPTPSQHPTTPTRPSPNLLSTPSSFLSPPSPPFHPPIQTEPHNRRPTTLNIYNDTIPPSLQPQTPLDLLPAHRRTITERNIAYTAPPGQIRTAGRPLDEGIAEMGAQSPTMRAVRMRERRAREFGRWRGVRMGNLAGSGRGGLLDREDVDVDGDRDADTDARPDFPRHRQTREEDQEVAERTGDRGPARWARMSGLRSRRDTQPVADWREGFDEDRVGEENF